MKIHILDKDLCCSVKKESFHLSSKQKTYAVFAHHPFFILYLLENDLIFHFADNFLFNLLAPSSEGTNAIIELKFIQILENNVRFKFFAAVN